MMYNTIGNRPRGHRDVPDFIFKEVSPKSAKKQKIKSCAGDDHIHKVFDTFICHYEAIKEFPRPFQNTLVCYRIYTPVIPP